MMVMIDGDVITFGHCLEILPMVFNQPDPAQGVVRLIRLACF